MIGFVKGSVVSKHGESLQCVVLVNDVGYELRVHKRLFETLPPHEEVSLWVHTHVKEGVLAFYGFGSENEKQLFRILLTVTGLGPKGAMSLLGEHGAERLAQFILQKKAKDIATAPGVGKKSAERLVLELRPKLEKLCWLGELETSEVPMQESGDSIKELPLREDLLTALVNLGYPSQQIRPFLDKHFEDHKAENLGFEQNLKLLLSAISGRGARSNQTLDN